MKYALRSLLMMTTLAGAGCVTLRPVGPMADQFRSTSAPIERSPGVKVSAAKDAPGGPVLPPAPPPPSPTVLISPGEVNETNSADSIKKLLEELNTDRRMLESMPRYAEVSVLK